MCTPAEPRREPAPPAHGPRQAPDARPGAAIERGFSRRAFHRGALGGSLGTLFSYSLLGSLAGCDAFPREVAPEGRAWMADMQALAESVKGGAIAQVEWQDRAEELFARVDPTDLMQLVDFERLARTARLDRVAKTTLPVNLPRVEGLPDELTFGDLFFALNPGSAVPPHGHMNMVTGFVVLQGRFRGRHFDRLEDHPDHMLLAPTIDRTFLPGDASTISDHRDNVHWFLAEGERGYLFNVHVHHIDPAVDQHGRILVNPTVAPRADGRIRAPKIGAEESRALFGPGSDGTEA
jgi:hypothetical protein